MSYPEILAIVALVTFGTGVFVVILSAADERIPGVNEPGYLPEDAKK